MRVKFFYVILLSQLLVACAVAPENKVTTVNSAVASDTVQQTAVVAPKDVEKVKTPLSAELLFNILAGELAGKKGHIPAASAFYTRAATISSDPDLALRAVQVAIFNKDIAAAKSMVNLLLEKGQVNAQVHQLALTVYLAAGDVNKSIVQANALVAASEIPPRNTLLALGDMISRSGNKQVAYGVIDGLIASYAAESAVYLSRSQIDLKFNEAAQAEQDAKKALELAPDWSAPYLQLARVYEKVGNIESGLGVLKGANERFSDHRVSMKYGQLLAHNKQYKEAEQQFMSILDADKNHNEARFSLALVLLKQEKVAAAKAQFLTLRELGGFSSESAFYLGRIDYSGGKLESAITWFKEVGQGRIYIDAQANVAMIKSKLGDLSGARAVAANLRRQFPKKATQFYVLEGELLANENQYSELFELMTEAVGKAPDDLTLRYTRSIAAAELDKIDVVESDLHKVLEKEPDNVNALNALGYTLASKTFRFDEARGYLKKALAFRPNDSAILDSMGWLNYRSGRYEEALVLLEKAYSKQPEAEIATHLGETLWVLGRQQEAKKIWQEASEKFPEDNMLIEALKRIQ
jgi:tetratricopeptide (TPR) repeat protein